MVQSQPSMHLVKTKSCAPYDSFQIMCPKDEETDGQEDKEIMVTEERAHTQAIILAHLAFEGPAR